MTGTQTVVFGLDGACFGLIQPWLENGTLPTLQRLMERGSTSALSSCVPATTPPAWSTLTTGVNPGKHGVFGFYRRQREQYEVVPVTDRDVHARRLWDYTSDAGLTSLVVNVPVTHPGRELDGALVPGYLAPNRPQTYPDTLLDDVGMEGYRVYAESEAEDVPEDQLLDEWLSLTDSRKDLAIRLMDAYEWDVLFVEFQKTDGAVHKFDDSQNVRRIFERVDECMAAILEGLEHPNVFVVSDHGIGQEKPWSVALNTWLVEEGYASTTTADRVDAGWLDQAIGRERQGDGRDRSASRSLLRGLSTLGLTKQRLERGLSAVGLYDLATRLAPKGFGAGLDEEVVDRANSQAFYEGMGFSGVDVGVVLNDERFYDDGTVEPGEYESLRDHLIEELGALTGPDGDVAFDRVRPREDVYSGPLVEYAPDIVLEQAPQYVIGSKDPRGKTFIKSDPGRIDHTRDGLLVAAGPDIEPDWLPDTTPSIADVTPTLLHLLDVPLHDRFDGEPLPDLLAIDRPPSARDYEEFRPADDVQRDAAEEQALEERLKGMGYLK